MIIEIDETMISADLTDNKILLKMEIFFNNDLSKIDENRLTI